MQAVSINSQDIGMEFRQEKCALLMMRSGKRQMTEGIELPNQEKFITFGEKGNYEYLGILEVDTIKKFKRSASRKRENYSKPNYISETSSKG